MNERDQFDEDIERDIDEQMDDGEEDVCHHSIGFDETCEWCDDEIAEEDRAERAAKRPPKQLPLLPNNQ